MTMTVETLWLASPTPVQPHPAAPAHETAAAGHAATPVPTAPVPPTPAATIDTWIGWTQTFAGLAGLVHTAGTVVTRELANKELADKIVHGLHALYQAIQAVNQAFLDEIDAIKAGKPIEITVWPSKIDDWTDDSKTGVVDAVWEAIQPQLQRLMKEVAAHGGNGAVVADAIDQFSQNAGKILADLRPLFGEADKQLSSGKTR